MQYMSALVPLYQGIMGRKVGALVRARARSSPANPVVLSRV